jgi:hypothetical protein
MFGQLTVYLVALITYFVPVFNIFKPFKLISYMVVGHIANFAGGLRYLLGMENGRWKRVNQ